MRVISGRFKGRQLAAPPGLDTRPTADRARQGLFNMLEHAPWSPGLRDAVVLDLFAGSGALGIEALSRGAATATFVETAPAAIRALKTNLAACRLAPPEAHLIQRDARKLGTPPPGAGPVQLVLADPPYRQGLGEQALAALAPAWLDPQAVAVIEEASGQPLADVPGWQLLEARRFGAATFHILVRQADTEIFVAI
jgi:16S rRNA (guanine966-N2)-methyltransferase